MKRFLRGSAVGRRHERGVTLTGYGLLMASMVVVSLGAIELMNSSSNVVLSNTGASVGNPRPSVSETKTDAVPTAPPWVGARGDGTCSAGLDGCPLGTIVAVDPAAYQPSLSGDVAWAGTAVDTDFTTLHDDSLASVFLESVVQLNGEWEPPLGGLYGTPAPVAAQPGDFVCTYLVHASPSSTSNTYNFDVQFPGQILGTAHGADFSPDPVFAAAGTTIPSANYIEPGTDNFDISGNTLSVNGFENSTSASNAYDQIRVFVTC